MSSPDDMGGTGTTPRRHIPVLLAEVLQTLNLAPGGTIIDGTFGAGGYSRAILDSVPDAHVLALDRDPTVIEAARSIMPLYLNRLTVVQAPFSQLAVIAGVSLSTDSAPGRPSVFMPPAGVVLDIGVSSMQIDTPERGFSFMTDGPLDMRMGGDGPSAADIVNTSDESDIADILFQLGEERRSRAIARAIVKSREAKPIATTLELARLVERVLGRAKWDERHPATRTFQALRIHVNDELGELAAALIAAEQILPPGGRLVVVTFHSLEDRVVKRFFNRRAKPTPAGSRHLPHGGLPRGTPGAFAPSFRIVNRNPLTPSPDEIAANPRARSAKLRAAERTEAPAFAPEDRAELGIPAAASRRG